MNRACARTAGVFGVVAVLSGAACATRPTIPGRRAPAYAYAIAPPPGGSWILRVEATFEGAPGARLVASEAPGAVRDVVVLAPSTTDPVPREGQAWVVPACQTRCSLRYTVDLEALAAGCNDLDCSRRIGDAILGTASAWMLRPQPAGDALIHVVVRGGDPNRFATGLRRDPRGGFVFRASELIESSYTAFGDFRRERVEAGGAGLDVVVLGPPITMGDAAELAWVHGAAVCVAGLFGRFPVDATVFTVPVLDAEGVVFGRVMSLAGASVELLFGDRTRAQGAHADWVVVHELFHLAYPSFVGEGHWLEEGLATYYEPILRERAGWMTESDLWTQFVREMPRGLRKEGEPASLEERDDIDSIYWGGAIFALLADVAIREASQGVRSLDDAMRAVLAIEGDGTHVARLSDFLRIGDIATGGHALAAVHDAWAVRGENIDLASLWHRLGVEVPRGGGPVTLHDDAPLSRIRRAMAAGPAH